MHRIGRTGRAGKTGNAISLVSAHEVCYLIDIEKLIKRPIEQVEVAGFEPEPEYEYPPGNKKKRAPARPVEPTKAPVAHQRPPRRSNMVAADGFDFRKPYEENSPHADLPDSPKAPARVDPHKPKKVVAALLGGLGRKS